MSVATARTLYVASLVSGGSLGDPVLASQGQAEQDRLTPPSWDGNGDLWVADRDPDKPRLLLLEQGAGEPLAVETPELDGRIEDVRVAADGVRIALVVDEERQAVAVRSGGSSGGGRSRRTADGFRARTAVRDTGVGGGHGHVVGRGQPARGGRARAGRRAAMRYVQVDGSTPEGPAPAALSGIKEITASEADGLPLVAYSEDGIVRLPSGTQWQKVTDGVAPVYPG